MCALIEVQDLTKTYGPVRAIDELCFCVQEGSLFAFLGPNGAGKSTTIEILCTFLKPDAGEALIAGHRLGRENARIRQSIGAVFQESLLDPLLTVEENLLCRGALYGQGGKPLRQACLRALEEMHLADLRKRRYGNLSGGQRRRADIARALIHAPKVLFLDEPTTGLDPQTRRAVWEILLSLRQNAGMTLFLTTHYLEEAEQADNVIILDAGAIAASGSPEALRRQYAGDHLTLSCTNPRAASAFLREKDFSFRATGTSLRVNLSRTLDALPLLQAMKGLYESFGVASGTLEDAFLAITGKELRE